MRSVIGLAMVGFWVATSPGPSRAQGLAPITPPVLQPQARVWIHLDDAADLDRLKATNPDHYRRARRILAAAQQICQPGQAQYYRTRFKDAEPSCESLLWMTSDPPRKRLTFHLDDVGYIALVSVKVSGKLIDGPVRGSSAR